jgi:Flp pilus assembly protein TadG
MVLLTPVVIVLTLLPVQVGLWMHGRNLVTVAAQEAAREAATADLSPAAAQERGRQAATRWAVDQRVVQVRTITVTRGPNDATATVTGHGLSLIPGLDLQVTGSAASAVEQFVGTGAP